jgi:uncharacterized coiled-coil protein SlyX
MFGNQWFGMGTEGVPDWLRQLGEQETALSQRLGLTPDEIARISERVSGSTTYGFGQEFTPWEQSGAAEKIMADRLKAASETLGLSIEQLTSIMSMSAEEWERTATQMQFAIENQRAGLSSHLRGLDDRLGVTGLQSFSDSLSVSEGLAPLDRLAGARSIYDQTLAAAMGGDLDSVRRFPEVAQQLLALGRDTYASGSGYQDLFREVNSSLNQVLEKQQAIQEEITNEVADAIGEASSNEVEEIRNQTRQLVYQFQQLQEEFKRMRLDRQAA